ncbi:MAG: tRNA uridine-5-carboxymethylaminomethyl(34) synthesis GTPase MnmE [Alphaproteobacteria bacterium]|jgi:tRNA modification GTPase
MDTIFALSSGRGKAGVAVVRISGNSLQKLFNKITNKKSQIKNRYAYLTDLIDENDELIDKAIAIYFSAPHSFTGEDVIELHVHGSEAVLQKLFSTLTIYGARMARPGEFSRRAFDNNKMDLIEVDGLSALLDAQTEHQRKLALKSMSGDDSIKLENWRAQMIEISAYAAAVLDYSSDELPENIVEKLLKQTQNLRTKISNSIYKSSAVRAIQSGFNITIVGPVNSGKSSLFNRLIGATRAIVSDIPGTTRDVVSADIDIDGYLVRISDTAGLRETDDEIEKIGIQLTNKEIQNADLVLRVQSIDDEVQTTNKYNEIIVINKSDLNKNINKNGLYVSALTGDGIDSLLNLIKEKLHKMLDGTESDIAVNERIKSHLIVVKQELINAEKQINNMDLFSEHVRIAADEIGQVLGVIDTSEVANKLFDKLCLGK